MIDQTKTFEKFIESLINQTGDEASFREAVLTIYGDGWRHSYSFVTRYILRNNKTSDDLAETLESLSEQIAELIPLFTEEKPKQIMTILLKFCNKSTADVIERLKS